MEEQYLESYPVQQAEFMLAPSLLLNYKPLRNQGYNYSRVTLELSVAKHLTGHNFCMRFHGTL